MKALNKKQINYSIKKILAARMALFASLFLVVVLAFMGPAIYHGMVTGDFTPFYALLAGGAGKYAFSMAVIGDIDQPSDIETAPNQIGFRLYLVALEQIDDTVSFPSPDANRNISTIPLLAGEYMHSFDGVKDSLKYVGTQEKGDVTSTFNKTFMIIIKHSNKSLDFIEQYQGKGFVLIYKECESNSNYLLGSYCKPVYLTNAEVKHDGDGKYITLTFGNDHWRQPLNYTGSIVTQAPVNVPQDATDLALQRGNDVYQLVEPSAAPISIITASGFNATDIGRRITLRAPATVTNANTVVSNAVFLLKEEANWVANPGSQLVLEVYDSDTLIEVDRIQTA